MYTSFSIENFRCFDSLTVEPLARVNLIAGPNNVGKTALLEGLWMLSYPTSPRKALRHVQRDFSSYGQEEFFAELFPQYQADLTIRLHAENSHHQGSRTLNIQQKYRSQQPLLDLSGMSENESDDEAIADFDFSNELVFQYMDEISGEALTSAWIDAESTAGRLRPVMRETRESARNSARPCVFDYPKSRYGARPLASLFGKAQFAGRMSSFETIIRLLEPRLNHLTTIADSRGVPAIYGDISGGRLLPISIMGEGTKRLLALSLAFFEAQNGVMLIDEVENGLHYSVLADVWKNLEWLSREFNVQVFATTHSYECIRAANDAFSEMESDDLHFHRLFWKDKRVKSVTYQKKPLNTNIDYFWELR